MTDDQSWDEFKDEVAGIVREEGPIETSEVTEMVDRTANPTYGALKHLYWDGRIERDGDTWDVVDEDR